MYNTHIEFMVFNATFNNILSYIVAVSFIGGRNQRPVALKLLVGFNTIKKLINVSIGNGAITLEWKEC